MNSEKAVIKIDSSFIVDIRLKMIKNVNLQKLSPLADTCKALSHPARIAILQILAERRSCICGEIVKLMPLSQATVSQHLKVLKDAGFISGTIDGPKSCYCIDTAAIAKLRALTEDLFGKLESCC